MTLCSKDLEAAKHRKPMATLLPLLVLKSRTRVAYPKHLAQLITRGLSTKRSIALFQTCLLSPLQSCIVYSVLRSGVLRFNQNVLSKETNFEDISLAFTTAKSKRTSTGGLIKCFDYKPIYHLSIYIYIIRNGILCRIKSIRIANRRRYRSEIIALPARIVLI